MSRTVDLPGGRIAHASGALWIPHAGAVLVADVHLGYGWAQRRRGELGPVIDTKSEAKLRAMLDELRPKQIVFLGDIVHAPRPGVQERAFVEETLRSIGAHTELVVVRGNHDRAFGRDFAQLGLVVVEEWRGAGVRALHGDKLTGLTSLPEEHLVLGHLHPALGMRDAAGASQRLPLFLSNEQVTVLPAFSPYAAGWDVRRGMPGELNRLLRGSTVQGVVVTGRRAAELGPLRSLKTDVANSLEPFRKLARNRDGQ